MKDQNKGKVKSNDVIAAIDPRLNCAAKICCPPMQARHTQIELLCEAGCPDNLAPVLADRLEKMGISFAPSELMDVIARLAQHPDAL